MTSAEKLQEFEAGQSGIRGNFLLTRFLVPGVWTWREERTAITFMQTVQYGTCGDVGTTNRVFICKKNVRLGACPCQARLPTENICQRNYVSLSRECA